MLVSKREKIALFGGAPIFERPLNIVRPQFPPVESFIDRFRDALASGQVTNNGPWVRQFESELTAYLAVPTVTFCNGQLALLAMLKASDIEGKEVIVPSFTFSATPHAVRWCGGNPIFADIKDDGSLCIDPEDVERKITENTTAILGVDPYGIMCDYQALTEIAGRHKLKLLFDSAPAFGSKINGRPTGGFGHAQIFSFHATKAFATMEGGCVCSDDRRFLERVQAIRNFGLLANGDCEEPGINGKMPEISAMIGLEQLKTFEAAASIRRRSVARISAGLNKLPGLQVGTAPENQEPVWLYLPVLIDRDLFGVDRDQLAAAFEKENLYVRKYYSPPCHHMTAYKGLHGEQNLPVTERAAYNVVALPVYNDMKPDECDRIVEAFFDIHRCAPEIREHFCVSGKA